MKDWRAHGKPRGHDGHVERAMTACGVLLAFGAGAFAWTQIAGNDGNPKVNGAQHLALFGRPKEYHDEKQALALRGPAPSVEPVVAPRQPAADAGVDFAQTATISERPAMARGDPFGSPIRSEGPDYRVRRVLADRVIVESKGETFILRIGEAAAGVGRLTAIVMREGRRVAVIGPAPAGGQTSR